MESLVLSPNVMQRVTVRNALENLGPQWRCTAVATASQARGVCHERQVGLAVVFPGTETDLFLAGLRTEPLLAPPYAVGAGTDAPDGPCPSLEALPELLRTWRGAGHLPALTELSLPRATRLAEGILHAVGIPEKLRAWDILPDMLALTAVHPPLLTDLQHVLYPLAGRRHGLTPGAVERRLRLCIESTWSRGELSALERFFGHSVDPERGKPTNREFLCRLQERLTLAMDRVLRP